MKKWLYILIAACVFSCGDKSLFTIRGKLPSNKYDGEWMYLVPLVGASRQTIDSVRVKNGSFEFHGDDENIYVLRMKPILRLELQELLVITEKGNIKVNIAESSSVSGTPQNETLQRWKDKQMELIRLYRHFHDALESKCSKVDSIRWIRKLDAAKMKQLKYSIELIKEQKNNTLGRFLYRQFSFMFSSKDKASMEPIFKKKK